MKVLQLPAIASLLLLLTAPHAKAAAEYMCLKTLAIVYTDTFAGMANSHPVENVRHEVDEAVEFIWRSSRMRLHLAVDDLTIYRFVPEDQFAQPEPGHYILPYWTIKGTGGSVTDDLAYLGYESGSYDVVVAFYPFEQGPARVNLYGAGSYSVNSLLEKAAYVAIPMTWRPDTFNGYVEHEFLHVLRDIFSKTGYSGFPMIHNVKIFKLFNGKNASYEKWLLGRISGTEYLDTAGRWGSVEAFKDRDGDGVPDYSPPGDELSITEETLGSSAEHADTDNDGLSDLEEVTAGVRSGSDPNHPDTDGDGLIDGSDPDPLEASEPEAW